MAKITEQRIDKPRHDFPGILDGDINAIIEALQEAAQKNK